MLMSIMFDENYGILSSIPNLHNYHRLNPYIKFTHKNDFYKTPSRFVALLCEHPTVPKP